MLRKSVAAALLAGTALLPGAALAATAFTAGNTELRSGPDYDYPTVRVINDGRRVEVFGCLSDWSFCDVGYRSDRGWVAGDNLVVDYRSARTRIVEAAPYIGIGVLTFDFDNYWDTYYRGRPFYTQRRRWERHYFDHFQAHWGPRPDHHGSNDHDHGSNDHDHHGDNDRHDNNRLGRNDRNDDGRNDNNAAYRGKAYNAPNQPVVAPAPQPGLNDNNRPGGNEHGNNDHGANDHGGDRHGKMGGNNAMQAPGNMGQANPGHGPGGADRHETPHTPQQAPASNPPATHQSGPMGAAPGAGNPESGHNQGGGGERHGPPPQHGDNGQRPKHDKDQDNGQNH